jgi:hypothetical protein
MNSDDDDDDDDDVGDDVIIVMVRTDSLHVAEFFTGSLTQVAVFYGIQSFIVVFRSQPFNPILNQMNSVHIMHPVPLTFLSSSSDLSLDFQSNLFSLRCQLIF